MKKYTIFQAVYLAFFSADFYRAVARRWNGIGFGYLLLLVLVATLPGAVRFWAAVAQLDRQALSPVTAQFPQIKLEDGEAQIDVPQPLHITDPETGQLVAIIDTTGKTDLDKHQRVVLITKRTIVVKQPHKVQEVPIQDLQQFLGDPVVIDRVWVEDTILWWLDFVSILYLPVMAALAFVYRFVQMLIFGLIGLLMASSRRPPLSYAQALRLSAMALTPVIVLNTFYELMTPLHALWCFWWVICLMIAFLYLNFGIRAAYERPYEDDQFEKLAAFEDDDDFDYEGRR